MKAYYNDNESYVAQWLRNLIAAGLLSAGDVDERSIAGVQPEDLREYRQCHFFAGIGGWPLALQLAGWPNNYEVWTGSCPCQPLSCAGQRKGHADKRHLWPALFHLISECRPAAIFGEQVASKDGREWLSAVRADMESIGYAVGAADLPAASVGAPHIRQRLFFVADANSDGRSARTTQERRETWCDNSRVLERLGTVAHRVSAGLEVEREQSARQKCTAVERNGAIDELGDADSTRPSAGNGVAATLGCRSPAVANGWTDIEWIQCIDGKQRSTKPGLFPLAHGIPGRVGRVRAYGSAIVPQVAAEFIKAVMEALP